MKPQNILVLPLAGLLLAPPASAQAPKKKKAPTGETQVVSLSPAAEPKPAPAPPPALKEEGPTLQETKDFVLARLRKQEKNAEIRGNIIFNCDHDRDSWYSVDISHLELSLLKKETFAYDTDLIIFAPKTGKLFPHQSGDSDLAATKVQFRLDRGDADEVIKAIRYWAKLIGNTQRNLKFD